MSNMKYKSLEAIKASIRAGRKYAMENNPPADPNEESVPAENKDNVQTPADLGIPGGDKKNVNTTENEIIANTPIDQTLRANESDVKAKVEDPEDKTEKEVSIPAPSEEQKAEPVNSAAATNSVKEAAAKVHNALSVLVEKAKQAKKEASSTAGNIASGIDLSPMTLSKIASLMLDTEQGRQLAMRTLEENKAEQIKQASLKELLVANEIFKQEEEIRKTAAYKEAEAEFTKIAAAHEAYAAELNKQFAGDPEFAKAVKLAYAQGATDVAAIQGGAEPTTEPTPAAEQEDIMAVIQELLQSGQINEQQAQAIAQLAAEVAQADGNPELSPEEEQLLLQAAVEQGLLPPEMLQQLSSGQAAAPAAPMPPVADPSMQAAAAQGAVDAQGAVAPEGGEPKTAAIRKLAANCVKLACGLKKVASDEGALEEGESEDVTVDDIDTVIDQLVENGEISSEEADAVKDEIAEEISSGVSNEVEVANDADDEGEPEEVETEVDEVSPEDLREFLVEQGVTPEELEAALADIPEEELCDESGCNK